MVRCLLFVFEVLDQDLDDKPAPLEEGKDHELEGLSDKGEVAADRLVVLPADV